MRLTRRMGPNYRAGANGRLLRLFVWSSCLAAVLTLRPFATAQDARPGFGKDDPRITTSAPIFIDKIDTVIFTPSASGTASGTTNGSASDIGTRTASAGPCELQSTYSDANFEGPSDYSIVFGLAETEIFAASYTIAPEFFPIEINSVEMVFAQIGDEDMTTELELLILKGTPNQGQIVASFPHTLNFPACDDGLFCNGTEGCEDGVCVSGLAPCAGQLCDEGLAACVECLNTTDCDDGQFCEVASGVCFECLDATHCDDGDDCTIDTCNANGQCEFTIDVFAPCNDGEACTVDDTCNAVGQCGGVPDVGASCNDGDVCTSNDTCDAVGQCGGDPNVGASCDDGDGCTAVDTCDAEGQCVGEPCDDGLFCNGQERCVNDVCVEATPPCVAESCDEDSDVCECAADTDCDDSNPCTDNVCTDSECEFPNNSLGCNDLDPCTNGDACVGGSCAGAPVDCNDGDPCTEDTCEPGNGQCSHATGQCGADLFCEPDTGDCVDCLVDVDCDDGLFCSGIEICNFGTCLADTDLPCPGQLCDEDANPHCFDSSQSCDAINVLIDLSAAPVTVENNGTDTFSVGFRILEHNNPSKNACAENPPANNNAFPTVDVNGVENEADNWLFFINCGPLGCPAGWNRFEDLAFCAPDGDWNLRANWSSPGCGLERACCFEDGDCQVLFETECEAAGGTSQQDETTCEPNPCPPPIEACCFADTEGCIDLDPDFCTNVGGTGAGADTSCASFTCFPTGACCKPNGFCVDDVSVGECEDALLGTYQGEGTTCAATNCPDPVGACCFSPTSCIVLTQAQCDQGGAIWHGPATDCEDSPDDGDELPDACQDQPIGACCLPQDECADGITSDACDADGGAFQGTGSECADIGDECLAPTGACCLPAGQCLPDEDVADCEAAGGAYQGDDSNCTSCETEACCFEGAGCLDFPSATCAAAGGSAQGPGTTCTTTPCPLAEGACCFETGLCLELTLGECNQGGGSWLGGDSVCEPELCEGAALGACCTAGDQCIDGVTPAACLALPGDFQGDGSTCAAVECDVVKEFEACCADTGACILLTVDDCVNGIGGTPQGPGTTCEDTECSGPVGACCAGDGSCSVGTQAECDAGSYLGDGSDCTAGLCCADAQDCDDAEACNGEETCQSNVCQDGAPLNCDDSDDCTDDSCDPVSGCMNDLIDCDDGDDCTIDSCNPVGGCENLPIVPCCGNGEVEGPGEECDPPDGITCDENCQLFATGACCSVAGNCEIMSENACDATGGTYQGDDTICEPDLCPECMPTKGAAENDCCLDALPISTGLTNFNTTNANTDGPVHLGACEFDGQTYHDIWYEYTADCSADTIVTTCESLGAGADYDTDLVVYDGCDCDDLFLLGCNDDDESCGDDENYESTVTVSMISGNCYMIRVGGWFDTDFGIGMLLIDPQCGACCQGDACSENQGADQCADAGGDYQGEGVTCGDVDCTTTGACCVAGGNCTAGTPQACTEQNGSYEGDTTTCDPDPCGCGDCPTDADGDGMTSAADLAILLGNWDVPGPAALCLDADGDGMISAADLAVLLGNWGPCD